MMNGQNLIGHMHPIQEEVIIEDYDDFSHPIPVITSSRVQQPKPYRNRRQLNVIEILPSSNRPLLPIVLCTNARSARYKLNDLGISARHHQVDIVCVVETWFDETMTDECLSLGTEFSPPVRNDRQDRIGGGVAAWFQQHLVYKRWQNLEDPEFESLWFTVWSTKMPRSFNKIILGIIYNPATTMEGHRNLSYHIINSVDHIKRHHPYSGVMIVGDFNQFPDRLIVSHLKVKQLIKAPTRGSAVLDKCFTDVFPFYNDFLIVPPISSSDHNSFVCYPSGADSYDKGSLEECSTRVMGQNEKTMFCYELSNIQWEPLYHLVSYEDKVTYFSDILSILLDKHFPPKTVVRHTKDKPWITDYFKSLISKRQFAYLNGDMDTYKKLRNKVNRLSKKLESNFYKVKVAHLKTSDSRKWWKNIKELLGLTCKNNPVENIAQFECDGDVNVLAERINEFFRSVSSHLNPIRELDTLSLEPIPIPDAYLLRVEDVERRLASLKVNKSTGPDGIPAWVLRDFCHILAGPLTAIANASMQEGRVTETWKFANIVPIPKVPSPKDITSDLRPISITSVPGKALEYFPVKWMYDAIEAKIDPNQFGGVQNSSTALALIKIIDHVAKNCDSSGTTVRMLLVDFAKAFDLVDHSIVLDKLRSLGVHESLVRWSTSFLCERQQCVKIGSTTSGTVTVNAGCPQGTLMGPLVFVAHINDLRPPVPVTTIKYVDDTTVLHACTDPGDSTLQDAANYLSDWSRTNNMKFNIKKSKELIFTFKRSSQNFPMLDIEGSVIERVSEAKILGVTLQSDLKWNSHIENTIKKANKRLHLLNLCRRAGLNQCDLLEVYCSLIRSLLEYCSVVWHPCLPAYLSDSVEKVQKRALHIIFGHNEYDVCLEMSNLKKLSERREEQCKRLFEKMKDPKHKLHDLLPGARTIDYNLRCVNPFESIMCQTNRYANTFVPYCVKKFSVLP